MNQSFVLHREISWAIPLLIVLLVLQLVVGLIVFPRYTGLPRWQAVLALVASVIACGVYALVHMRRPPPLGEPTNHVLGAWAGGVCLVFLTAFVLRLWGRWVGTHSTEAERQPGLPGVRAWFSLPNVIVGVAIVLLAWFGFGLSPLVGAVAVGGLLIAQPVLRVESPATPVPTSSAAAASADLSGERDKILSMLEAGKLTPDESAELLQALGGSSRPTARQVPLSGGQRLMLTGAALVVIGFFLPWFVFNPGKEVARATAQMHNSIGSAFGGLDLPAGLANIPAALPSTPSVSVSGGDIRRGFGWAALVLALTAALIPYVAAALDAATLRIIRLLALGLGAIILLYLLTQNLRLVGVGLVIAIVGYALEIAGVLRIRNPAPA